MEDEVEGEGAFDSTGEVEDGCKYEQVGGYLKNDYVIEGGIFITGVYLMIRCSERNRMLL